MSFWAAIVLIVLIGSITSIVRAKYRAQAGIIADKQGNETYIERSATSDEDAQREILELRERIKVLERIATDDNSISAQETRRISQEIEALKGKQDSD